MYEEINELVRGKKGDRTASAELFYRMKPLVTIRRHKATKGRFAAEASFHCLRLTMKTAFSGT